MNQESQTLILIHAFYFYTDRAWSPLEAGTKQIQIIRLLHELLQYPVFLIRPCFIMAGILLTNSHYRLGYVRFLDSQLPDTLFETGQIFIRTVVYRIGIKETGTNLIPDLDLFRYRGRNRLEKNGFRFYCV